MKKALKNIIEILELDSGYRVNLSVERYGTSFTGFKRKAGNSSSKNWDGGVSNRKGKWMESFLNSHTGLFTSTIIHIPDAEGEHVMAAD